MDPSSSHLAGEQLSETASDRPQMTAIEEKKMREQAELVYVQQLLTPGVIGDIDYTIPPFVSPVPSSNQMTADFPIGHWDGRWYRNEREKEESRYAFVEWDENIRKPLHRAWTSDPGWWGNTKKRDEKTTQLEELRHCKLRIEERNRRIAETELRIKRIPEDALRTMAELKVKMGCSDHPKSQWEVMVEENWKTIASVNCDPDHPEFKRCQAEFEKWGQDLGRMEKHSQKQEQQGGEKKRRASDDWR